MTANTIIYLEGKAFKMDYLTESSHTQKIDVLLTIPISKMRKL